MNPKLRVQFNTIAAAKQEYALELLAQLSKSRSATEKGNIIRELWGLFGRSIPADWNYINSGEPIPFFCELCGDQDAHQRWDHFKQGKKCARCANSKRLDDSFIREKFLSADRIIPKDWNYINSGEPIPFFCERCGDHDASQTWDGFKQGSECAKCTNRKRLEDAFIRDEFLAADRIIPEDWRYITSGELIPFSCKRCGDQDARQSWDGFKQGLKCANCTNNKPLNGDDVRLLWWRHARLIPEGWECKNANTPIPYTCLICDTQSHQTYGDFSQDQGCKTCNHGWYCMRRIAKNPKLRNKPCTIYLVRITHKESGEVFIKIGITANSIKKRFSHIMRDFIIEKLFHKVITMEAVIKLENQTLRQFKDQKYIPKHTLNGGDTECFLLSSTDGILTFLKEELDVS